MTTTVTTLPCRAWLTSRNDTGRSGIGNVTLPSGHVLAFDVSEWRGSTAEDGAAAIEFTVTIVECPESDAWLAGFIERLGARVRA